MKKCCSIIISRADGVGDRNLVSGHEDICSIRSKCRIPVASAGNENKLEIEFFHHFGCKLRISARFESEQPSYRLRFFAIELQNIGLMQRAPDGLGREAILSQIHI